MPRPDHRNSSTPPMSETSETPDFEKLARQFFIDYVGDPIAALKEQLREVWNARGAADIVKVDAELYADGTSRTGLDKMLDLAIRTLDR